MLRRFDIHPQARAMLERAASSNEPPIESLLPSEARRIVDSRVAKSDIPSPAIHDVRDVSFRGSGGDLRVRLYRPFADPSLPVTMFFHGGGFMLGNLDTHDGLCRALAGASGSAVAAVEFRLSPEHRFPAAPDDCTLATRWVIGHASELGVNPNRFALAGESSGGNLAAVVAQQLALTNGPRAALQVLLLPAVDLSTDSQSYQDFAEGYLFTRSRARYYFGNYLCRPEDAHDPRASPLKAHSLAGLPAAFVIAAGLDPTLSHTEAYVARLREAGVPTEYVRYDGWTHGFLFWGHSEGSKAAIAATGAAIGSALGTKGMSIASGVPKV
jgi:acetyl esterase